MLSIIAIIIRISSGIKDEDKLEDKLYKTSRMDYMIGIGAYIGSVLLLTIGINQLIIFVQTKMYGMVESAYDIYGSQSDRLILPLYLAFILATSLFVQIGNLHGDHRQLKWSKAKLKLNYETQERMKKLSLTNLKMLLKEKEEIEIKVNELLPVRYRFRDLDFEIQVLYNLNEELWDYIADQWDFDTDADNYSEWKSDQIDDDLDIEENEE